jgi:hypothetical protein
MPLENPFGLAQAIELAGSAAVILLMLGVAAVLGFRMSTRIDQAELERLAAAEGARVDAAVVAPDGRSALARLPDGRLMIARVMGADISARFASAASVRLTFSQGRLNATFADTGFPPLEMRLEQEPKWLSDLRRSEAAP